jgi:hypothetical protein
MDMDQFCFKKRYWILGRIRDRSCDLGLGQYWLSLSPQLGTIIKYDELARRVRQLKHIQLFSYGG